MKGTLDLAIRNAVSVKVTFRATPAGLIGAAMLAAAIPVADHFARKGAFDRKALVGSRSAPRETRA